MSLAPDPMMDSASILQEKTRSCKQLFQRCMQIPDMNEDDWLEQKSAEFNWWTSGLNADKSGPGSLDSRLRLRLDVRDVVTDLLDVLLTALSKCEEIAFSEYLEPEGFLKVSDVDSQVVRSPSPWSDMSDSNGSQPKSLTEAECINQVRDAYQEQKFYIETNLEILIRIHAAIKKSGHKFRYQRADEELMRAEAEYQSQKARRGDHAVLSTGDPLIVEHERFRRFLTRIVLQNGYKEVLIRRMDRDIHLYTTAHGSQNEDHSYIVTKKKLLVVFKAYFYDPARLSPIQRRLINANVVRRNRLIHAGSVDKLQSSSRKHQDEFLQESSVAETVVVKQKSYESEQTMDHIKPVPIAPLSQAQPMPKPQSRKSFVSQAATGLESNFSITNALIPVKSTRSAATKMSARVANIDYPRCPADQGPFPCPYCPSILSHAYTKRDKWRAHVVQDLCPYVCIFADCKSPDDMYTSTYEWMSHMARHHSTIQWVCTQCSKQSSSSAGDSSTVSFDDPEFLKKHILDFHPQVESSEIDLMIQASKRSTGIQRVGCPLCRPGIVTYTEREEEDRDVIHPHNCNEAIGMVRLEEDEHIATHIHEFSSHAFPWPDQANTENRSLGSLSHTSTCSRKEITFRPSVNVDATSNDEGDIYSPDEILEIVTLVKSQLRMWYANSQDPENDLIHDKYDWIAHQITLQHRGLDKDAFLSSLNQCRIAIQRLQERDLGSGDYSEENEILSELQEHQEKLISILQQVNVSSTSTEGLVKLHTPTSPSKSITDLAKDNSRELREGEKYSSEHDSSESDPDGDMSVIGDFSQHVEGDSGPDDITSPPISAPDSTVTTDRGGIHHHGDVPSQDDALLPGMVESKTSQQSPQDFGRGKEVAQKIKMQISSLGDHEKNFTEEMNISDLLAYISGERLRYMPPRGSLWDRCLAAAQFFSLEVLSFGTMIIGFSSEDFGLASAALASCRVLLEIGHSQAKALLPVLVALNELAILLFKIRHIRDITTMPHDAKFRILNTFCDVVQIVGEIAVQYRRKVEGLRDGEDSAISFDATFGKQVNQIHDSRIAIYNDIWTLKHGKTFYTGPESMWQRLYQPSLDPLLQETLYDDASESRSEHTCHWIKTQLRQFLENQEKMLTITGPPGCGKSVLAGWVRERLTRPFIAKSYAVFAYTFPYDSEKELTSLACVKSLLLQLFEFLAGDILLYEQVAEAFSRYPEAENQASLVEDLWIALLRGLWIVECDGLDLIILTDGCDQIRGGQDMVIEFFGYLQYCVSGLSRTRVITFCRDLVTPTKGCQHLEITRQNLKDIQNHFYQKLACSAEFLNTPHLFQHKLIEKLSEMSEGNFLWAFLIGRLLARDGTPDALYNAPTTLSSNINDVLDVVVGQINLTEGGVLRDLLMAILETPIDVDVAAKLLCNDPDATITGRPSEIFKFMPEQCQDILLIQGRRIHFRHSIIRSYISGLF